MNKIKILTFLTSLLLLSISVSAQLLNDEPCNAISLPVNGLSTCAAMQGSTNTTGVPNPSSCTNGDADATTGTFGSACEDLWFSVTAPINGSLRIDFASISGSTDLSVAAYTATGSCPTLTLSQIACDGDGGVGALPQLNLTGLIPGSTIYIRVWQFNCATDAKFEITAVGAATNEPCNAPVLLGSGGYGTFVGATGNASIGVAGATCGPPTSACPDVWYQTVVPSNGSLTVNYDSGTSGKQFAVAAYKNDCPALPASGNYISCANSVADGTSGTLTISGQIPGDIIYLRVYDTGGTTCETTYGFNISVATNNVIIKALAGAGDGDASEATNPTLVPTLIQNVNIDCSTKYDFMIRAVVQQTILPTKITILPLPLLLATMLKLHF
ncbi:MAG: hypothetical protein IPN94_17735 [Sphingobacteriales bacterium]|nr:hypothetical protein [Sphingobacteriales bacterium]